MDDGDGMAVSGKCPGCGADLTAWGSVEAAEQHALRGRVRFDPETGDFTDLPLFDAEHFNEIEYDMVQEASYICLSCRRFLSSLELGGV